MEIKLEIGGVKFTLVIGGTVVTIKKENSWGSQYTETLPQAFQLCLQTVKEHFATQQTFNNSDSDRKISILNSVIQ